MILSEREKVTFGNSSESIPCFISSKITSMFISWKFRFRIQVPFSIRYFGELRELFFSLHSNFPWSFPSWVLFFFMADSKPQTLWVAREARRSLAVTLEFSVTCWRIEEEQQHCWNAFIYKLLTRHNWQSWAFRNTFSVLKRYFFGAPVRSLHQALTPKFSQISYQLFCLCLI